MSKFPTEWQLEKYFYSNLSDPQRQNDFENYLAKCDAFIVKYKGNIQNIKTDVELLEYLEEADVLDAPLTKYSLYLFYLFSLDTQNQLLQKEDEKMMKFYATHYEKFLFIDEEFKKIGYDALMEFSKSEILKSFKNDLIYTANGLKRQLSEAEEKVYLKMFSAQGGDLYEKLTTSFEFFFRGKQMTQDEVRTLRESPDREIRKEAFQVIADVYQNKQAQIVLSDLYSKVCKQNVVDMELRGYQTVVSQRNISEELSDGTVDTLLECVANAYPLYHKFLERKRQLLNLSKLHTYDIFAPVNFNGEKTDSEEIFTFEEGWELYKKAIDNVDPILSKYSDDMLQGGRISVFPKLGKSTGAFANYSKTTPSFVLLNWANTRNDVTTLAHELGHAFHGELSKKQKDAVYSTPLTLAETASIFNETLMFETILNEMEDDGERKELILNRLDDIFGTIFRQVAYVRFEKACHESFLKNEPLSVDDYDSLWTEEMKKLYGSDIEVEENLIKHGWSSIPHIFHSPFYCYTYAFGNIISLNIYENYKKAEDKKMFISKYHELLASGGSDTPENLLQNIFDIKFNETFYQTAFSHIEKLINLL